MRKTFRNEGDVKSAIKDILKKYKVCEKTWYTVEGHDGSDLAPTNTWYFMPSMNGYGRSGIPDFVCCICGFFLAVEAKFGSNGPTPNQVREGNDILAAGGRHLYINETNLSVLDTVVRYLISKDPRL